MDCKRDNTIKEKLVKLIKNRAGIVALNIPKHLRRMLRPLELEGVIEYRMGGWYLKQ